MLPSNIQLIWVRIWCIDQLGQPLKGDMVFTPNIKSPGRMVDADSKLIIDARSRRIPLDVDGKMAEQIFPTDDPSLNPISWNYHVQEPTGASYDLNVPYDTAYLRDQSGSDPADPLYNERVIDLYRVVPASAPDAGYAREVSGPRGEPGVSVTSITIDTTTRDMILHLSDGTTSNVGPIPPGPAGDAGPMGPAGSDGADGRGITGTSVNTSGELLVDYSDSSEENLGIVNPGPTGPSGVGISDVVLDGNNHLIITLTDSTTHDAGLAPQGAQGIQGPEGTQGPIGAQGPAGPDGPTGPAGPQGSAGFLAQPGAPANPTSGTVWIQTS